MSYYYTLKQSPIHGVGVFANAHIGDGVKLANMELIDVGLVEDFKSLPTTGVVSEKGHVLVPIEGFPLWAVNFSDEPNIRATAGGWVYALRDIRQGEELTIVYHESAKELI